MTKLADLRDRSVTFVECGSAPCPRHVDGREHMHCPCGCSSITFRKVPVAWTCENCGNSCFSTSYDRLTNLQICYKCQELARAARKARKEW